MPLARANGRGESPATFLSIFSESSRSQPKGLSTLTLTFVDLMSPLLPHSAVRLLFTSSALVVSSVRALR
jgi:hypothetical protein